MRPITVRLGALGVTPWVPMDRAQKNFKAALGVTLSSGATLTYTVQHTFDLLSIPDQNFAITRASTVATVTRVNHGLSVGDWLSAVACGAPFDGEFAVASVVDDDTFTYTVSGSGLTANGPGWLRVARVFPNSTLVAKIVSADGNFAYPPVACRLKITSYTDGFADFWIIQP